ncbi:protein MBD-R2-like [Haematobia irritans]|uniref:protein MBD-R2-like n=1 Tax=Haematobia irritans TaxID=7368 RepID=UPI003F4F7476
MIVIFLYFTICISRLKLHNWDVILVTPSGKRFRSKADLKTFLEEQGLHYNPDIYDFSIHRRRAKDLNCYVYTPGYVPQQPPKPKSILTLEQTMAADKTLPLVETLNTSVSSPYMDTPVAEPLPPMELLTSTTSLSAEDKSVTQVEAEVPKQLLESAEISSTPTPTSTPTVDVKEEIVSTIPPINTTGVVQSAPTVEDGYALIGGLKVQIVDNLFRCPEEGCQKNFRKENHLQIHVKHYHLNLVKLLGSCPKMQELAEKRTRPNDPDTIEPAPKNQIPNQQFFAKLHQQDLEHTRAHRRSVGALKPHGEIVSTDADVLAGEKQIKDEIVDPKPTPSAEISAMNTTNTTANTSMLDSSFASTTSAGDSMTTGNNVSLPDAPPLSKKSRFSPTKRTPGSRKSNRQRTTKRYLTAAQATARKAASQQTSSMTAMTQGDSSFSGVADLEETRHSFNATPDIHKDNNKKRKSNLPANTSLSNVESPITADSGSSSLQPLSANDCDALQATTQYIKENGELIKIVRMRQEEIINCLCGYIEEDGLMIQCELCLCWQHGICNGIDKESQVPDKYVCYICRHPLRARKSMQFKHDQDWLYEGKLPTANYHSQNEALLNKRGEYLKRSHTLTGNLLELKDFMHSLKVKINIANNKCHPKLYLWAKKWDEDIEIKTEIKTEIECKGRGLLIERWHLCILLRLELAGFVDSFPLISTYK